jgi:hypothetical protein
MKDWVQERAAENAYKRYQDNEDRKKYAELLIQIDNGKSNIFILNTIPKYIFD